MRTLPISVAHNAQFQNFNQFITNLRNYTSPLCSSGYFALLVHLHEETTTQKASRRPGNPSLLARTCGGALPPWGGGGSGEEASWGGRSRGRPDTSKTYL